MSQDAPPATNFIRQMIAEDVANGKNGGEVLTRFPPEPNGYLHIGHAKSMVLNFGVANEFGGACNLRFDDSNPDKESVEYVDAIRADVEWLGYKWNSECYASDYYQQLHDFAVELIKQGKAYVDSLSADEIREYRGTLTEPGKESPYRNRSVEENLDLFERMRNGEFDEGAHILRAKIDMASGNINLRDPGLYRIKKTHHYRTGDDWCIYPMYDYTHCLSDSIEGVTHSLCTLEFEDHRPLYDWVLEQLTDEPRPEQTEFSRLNLEYTILSKRKLIQLVNDGHVSGWDDPRMPSISGIRRRGFPPAAVRDFCERIGITKKDAWIEMAVLENSVRENLNENAPRRMAVLDPLKVVITNYDADKTETLNFDNHPQNPDMGKRRVSFSREVYIERDDFAEVPPPKFKRLISGGEVRLRNSYVIRCDEVIKDAHGNITELYCSADFDTLGKKPEGRKVKGVIHWVAAAESVDAEIRLYDRLFNLPNPNSAENLADSINPDSLCVLENARVERSLVDAKVGETFQFERQGYFAVDSDTRDEKLVFNRTVTLRDTWAN
ncbi:MAG: glutamine--tRNA ligase/YqeY domain fusion protein [Pseudomonadota bacterium]